MCIAVLNSCIKSFLWYASISRKPLIHSLSTDGHKGSFIGIMFVLHSCCVLAAFTTTSETVYWYNVGRDFRHARCRCWYCRRRYGSERPEVSLFPVNYLISCWKDAVKVLPWNGASQPWQHPSSKIMDTYRWRWETCVASFSRSRAAPNWNASIPAWLMPSAQIRISRIYVVDSIFTKLPLFIAYIFTPRCFGSDNIRNGIGRGEKSRSVSLHPVFEKT